MTLSRMKGENLQTIFDETYDNYLDDVYRSKERPKAQAGLSSTCFLFSSNQSFEFRQSFLHSTGSSSRR